MGTWWELALVSRTTSYVPKPQQLGAVLKSFQDRFGLQLSEVSGNPKAKTVKAAVDLLCKAAAPKGEAEVRFQCDPSAELFGWDPDADDPDENFWSDTLVVTLRPAPWPLADWEDESAQCPACKERMVEAIDGRLMEGNGFSKPLSCECGVATAPEKLKYSKGVRLARFVLTFWGNKGWYRNVRKVQDAFKDKAFLPALEKLLGTPLDVVAISS